MRDMDLDNFISNYSRPGWVEQGTAALEVRPDDDLMSVSSCFSYADVCFTYADVC